MMQIAERLQDLWGDNPHLPELWPIHAEGVADEFFTWRQGVPDIRRGMEGMMVEIQRIEIASHAKTYAAVVDMHTKALAALRLINATPREVATDSWHNGLGLFVRTQTVEGVER